jgi:hypothetical protein
MFWTMSNDGGNTFATAIRLGKGTWKLDACPMDGGAAAVTEEGKIAAIWRRDKEVYLTANQASDEQHLGNGLQPWLAANSRGLYSVWLTSRPGDLFLAVPGDDEPRKLASRARDPVVSTQPGSRGPVVVAWETEENGHPVIKAKTIESDAE